MLARSAARLHGERWPYRPARRTHGPAPMSPGPRAWDDPPIGDLAESGPVVVAVDGSERSLDALSLADLLAGTLRSPTLIAFAHPNGRLSSLLSGGDYERLLRDVAERTFTIARERLQSVSERRMELVAAESPGAPGSASSRAPRPRSPSRRPATRTLRGRCERWAAASTARPSPSALHWAAALARRASARLRVVAVHEPVPLVSVSVIAGPPTGTANQVLRRQLHEQLDAAVSALEPGVEASAELSDGSPAHALRERSGELDLLVLGSRGYGPLRAVLLGSVSSGLVRSAESPMVVVPRDAGEAFRARPARGGSRSGSTRPGCACRASRARWLGGGRPSSC